MGFCWRRIVFSLFVFLAFFVSTFVFRGVSIPQLLLDRSFSSHQVNITEEVLLERLVVSFPDIIMQLSKLNLKQQKKLIEQVRRDVVAAASASGQSDEQASKLGETVVMALSKAMLHPSVVDAYF